VGLIQGRVNQWFIDDREAEWREGMERRRVGMAREFKKIGIIMEKKRALINGCMPVRFEDISGTILEHPIFLWHL
jgi:hypothetical protein